jgi:hypothetical protein
MGYTIWPDGSIGEVLQDVYRERTRQEDLKAKGKFLWTCSDNKVRVDANGLMTRIVTNPEKLAVLAEEFGEVSREVTEQIIAVDKARVENDSDVDRRLGEALRLRNKKLKEELIQLAAVAVTWAESLSQ